MSQFYAIIQEANETVPQFVIRFQNLRKQLTPSPTLEELSGQPIEEVIKRVLRLDSA